MKWISRISAGRLAKLAGMSGGDHESYMPENVKLCGGAVGYGCCSVTSKTRPWDRFPAHRPLSRVFYPPVKGYPLLLVNTDIFLGVIEV